MNAPVHGTRPPAADATNNVAVTVVAFNNRESIGKTVADALAIPECTTVVVVDNGLDGSGGAAEAAGAVALSMPDNPGFGASQNLAVSASTEPFVLLLNPDAILLDGAIGAGLDVLLSDDRVAAVQGVITSRRTGRPERSMGPDLTWKHLWGRALGLRRLLATPFGRQLARTAGVGDAADRVPVATTEVETLAATALLVRRTAFDEVGGFDESYFLYGEDLDLCSRLRRVGWTLVAVPTMWATHDDGSTAASRLDRELTWWTGTLRYAARWWNGIRFIGALAAGGIVGLRLTAQRPRQCSGILRSLLKEPIVRHRLERTAKAGDG